MRGGPTAADAVADEAGPVRRTARRVAGRTGGPWVLLATAVAAALWTARLGANPLFVDEAASWSVAAQGSLGRWWSVLLHQEVAPPPFYAGLRLVVDVAGASGHVALRLPVVLLTLPCVPLVALLARGCGGSSRAAAGAAWLVALSPLMLMHAGQARAYGPAATATVLAFLLTLRAREGPPHAGPPVEAWRRRPTVVAGLAIGVAPWIHYVAWLPLVPLLVVAMLAAPGRRRALLGATIVPLWVGAAAVALVQYRHVGAGMDGVTELGGDDLLRVLAGAWDGRFSGGTTLLVLGCAGSIAGLAACAALRGPARVVAVAGVVGPIAIVVVSAVGPDIVTTRYLVPGAPLSLVAVALAVDRVPRPAGAVVVGLLAAVGALGVGRSLAPSTGDHPDFERIAGYVVPSLRPGTTIASESFFVGTWIPEYVAARAGVPDVRRAWGQGQLVADLCARRRVLQLSEPAGAAAARGFLAAAGYAVRTDPTPSPGWLLLTAEPRGPAPAACAALDGPPA